MFRQLKARHLLLGLIFFSFTAFAADVPAKVTINTNLPGPYSVATGGPVAIVANAYYLALALGGLLAFGSIVYAGIKWTASRGNASVISDAQDQITQAVIGLLILLGTYIILNTINPTLTLLNIPQLSEIKSEVVAPPPSGGPPAPGACPISPLTPIEQFNDPQAVSMEGGNSVIWNSADTNVNKNLAKLQGEYNKLAALGQRSGFSTRVNSIYRPLAYQTHLYEIYDRDKKLAALSADDAAKCADLKTSVTAEERKHAICSGSASGACLVSSPNGCAPHVKGVGIDITIAGSANINYSYVNSLLPGAGIDLRWQALSGDPVHFNLVNPPFTGCAAK